MTDPKPYVRPEVMLDIETLGKRPGCAILSVGLYQFAGAPVSWLHGSEAYYREIALQTCTDVGLAIEVETLTWWMKQASKPPIGNLTASPLHVVLRHLQERIDTDTLVWANSPNFDCTILEAAFDACRMIAPWSYANLRCLRTALDLLPHVPPDDVPREDDGGHHHALSDAKWQARRLLMARERAKRTDYI